MVVIATPLGSSRPRTGWPAGARIRYGAVKARWLRFRRGRRARLAVTVLTVIGSHEAVVSRITLYGASLHGGRRLKRREMIALRLPSGWRVKARVQWRFGSRCGIVFLTPVADFARLLCEGAVVRRTRKGRRSPLVAFPIPAHRQWPLAARLADWARCHADRLLDWVAAKRERHGRRSR